MTRKERSLSVERARVDTEWVANLADATIERAFNCLTEIEEDSGFHSQLLDILKTGGRMNYVQIAAPFELYALTRLLRPDHIVEIGVSAGISSAYFLRAITRNRHGRLHSIDLPEHQIGSAFSSKKNSAWCLPPGKPSGWVVPNDFRDGWDLRLGRSGELLPELIDSIQSCGLFLYDVPYTKVSAIADFQVVDEKLKKGSVVLADNCLAPLAWWATIRNAMTLQRKGIGLRGFRIS